MIQFLFRKSKASRSLVDPNTNLPREEKTSKQWTNKLASLVDEDRSPTKPITEEKGNDTENGHSLNQSTTHNTSLRLEGPYFTPANPASYNTVICLVAGTGISGAIAIAAAFSAQFRNTSSANPPKPHPTATPTPSSPFINKPPTWTRCIILWSIRSTDYTSLPFFQPTPGLDIRPHLTGPGHQRIDAKATIGEICAEAEREKLGSSTWVYISGPNAFIESGERACREVGVGFFGARWA